MRQYKALGINFTFHDGREYNYRFFEAITIVEIVASLFLAVESLIHFGIATLIILFIIVIPVVWFCAAMFMAVRKAEETPT